MLSFQTANEGQTIQVYCDYLGLEKLISVLETLRGNGIGHVHLRSSFNGGDALSDTTPFGENAVGEVIVTVGGDE